MGVDLHKTEKACTQIDGIESGLYYWVKLAITVAQDVNMHKRYLSLQ